MYWYIQNQQFDIKWQSQSNFTYTYIIIYIFDILCILWMLSELYYMQHMHFLIF